MKTNDQSRFSLVLDRARRALDEPGTRREARPTLRTFEERRASPPPLGAHLDPFVQMRAKGLHGAVDPITLALVDRIRAAGRELSRMSPLTLVLRLRQRGDKLRAAMFHDQTEDRDDG